MSRSYRLIPAGRPQPLLSGEVVPRWAYRLYDVVGYDAVKAEVIDHKEGINQQDPHMHRYAETAVDCALKRVRAMAKEARYE